MKTASNNDLILGGDYLRIRFKAAGASKRSCRWARKLSEKAGIVTYRFLDDQGNWGANGKDDRLVARAAEVKETEAALSRRYGWLVEVKEAGR